MNVVLSGFLEGCRPSRRVSFVLMLEGHMRSLWVRWICGSLAVNPVTGHGGRKCVCGNLSPTVGGAESSMTLFLGTRSMGLQSLCVNVDTPLEGVAG